MPFPDITLNDRLLNALDEIISTINSPSFKYHNPTLQFNNQTVMAIQIIANMLHRLIPKPALPPPKPFVLSPTIPNISLPSQINQNVPLPRVVLPSPKVPSFPPNVHPFKSPSTIKPHPHTILKQRANNSVSLSSSTSKIINRLLHIYNKTTGKKETLRSLLNNQQTKETWAKAARNEYGHLLTGNDNNVSGIDTMEPIELSNIPIDKTITYGTMVCNYKPLKTEKYRWRLVVGGD